jgi:hypothetical protein
MPVRPSAPMHGGTSGERSSTSKIRKLHRCPGCSRDSERRSPLRRASWRSTLNGPAAFGRQHQYQHQGGTIAQHQQVSSDQEDAQVRAAAIHIIEH